MRQEKGVWEKFLLWGVVVLWLGGCASEVPEYAKAVRPLHVVYNEGLDSLLNDRFSRSLEIFKEVDQHYPYTVWAKRALILRMYAHYRLRDCTQVSSLVTYYTELYPADREKPYAEYLRGRCYYDDMLVPGRDQGWTKRAQEQFERLIAAYPESVYSQDGREKLEIVRSRLAGHELRIGRYYQRRGEFAAAMRRYQGIVRDYGATLYIEEALHRLVESSLLLGLVEEARYYGSLLGFNYGDSPWYERSYALLEGVSWDDVPEEPSWELEDDMDSSPG
jgi:outer membrane protein assembly factor BamD